MRVLPLTLLIGILLLFSCQKNIDPPVANFQASNNNTFQGVPITFTDSSTSNPMNWSWVFNGGTPAVSKEKNPRIVYHSPGLYNVSLSVSNSSGTNTKTRSGYILIREADVQLLLDNAIPISDILVSYSIDSLYGKKYKGGLFFYYDGLAHGLVAAEVDQSNGVLWGCDGIALPGFTCSSSSLGGYDFFGTGCLGLLSAWGLCEYLTYNSYTDWALPSALTLTHMYQNLHLKGFGNFSPTASYWSYCVTDVDHAKSVSFANGNINDYSAKSLSYPVRAIRAF